VPTVQLTANPFCILGVSIRSTRDEIVAAYEDALVDSHQHDESALLRAQQTLLAPKTRLEAELNWLPELSPARAKQVLDGLDKTKSPTEAERLLDGMAGMSRANLSAALCGRFPGNGPFVSGLISAWLDISVASATATLASHRAAAGFTKPDPILVKEALTRVEDSHAKAAVKSVEAVPHPGRSMAEIIGPHVSKGAPHNFLAVLIREYDRWSTPKLREIGDRITAEVVRLRQNPKTADAAIKISELLPAWDEFSQPVQLVEQAKGLDEPRTMQLVNELRELCLWLANDQHQYASALIVSEAVQHSFSELPYVARQLAEDVGTLHDLAAGSKQEAMLAPLRGVAQMAKAHLDRLNADLVGQGFSSTAHGIARTLYDAFDAAAKATQSTEAAAVPWLIMRDLALALHNEKQHTDSAYAITRALLYHRAEKPPEVKAQLEKDERQLRREVRMADLQRALQSGDIDAGIRLADEVLSLTDDAYGRQSVLSIQAQLRRRRNAGRLKWLFWGGVAVAGAIWFIVQNQEPKRPAYAPLQAPAYTTPSASYVPPAPLPSSTTAEDKPPVGRNRLLTTEQVRYCTYQGERIEFLRPLPQDNAEIDRFNAIVSDFNSRCASYEYRKGVLQRVEGELPSVQPRLKAEAEAIAQSWRKKGTTRDLSLSPSGSPQPTTSGSLVSESPTRLLDLGNPLDAKVVQQHLISLGLYNGAIDGAFGKNSRAALRRFKELYAPPADDVWDLRTQQELLKK
jgi:hypothetical protein